MGLKFNELPAEAYFICAADLGNREGVYVYQKRNPKAGMFTEECIDHFRGNTAAKRVFHPDTAVVRVAR